MRVLIVDDSRALRLHLRGMMQGMGWVCDEADTGVAALEKARGGGEFGLALLDVNMPEMDGMECLQRLRAREDSMKVMMVTTESGYPVIEDALRCGADEFLMKPFTRESLRTKLMLMGLPV